MGAKAGTNPNAFFTSTGTSAATPFVAGLAALMLEKNNLLSSKELKSIISLSSYKTVNPYSIKDNVQGWGIIQAYAALSTLENPIKLASTTEIPISLNESFTVYSQPITLGFGHFFFELEQLGSAEAELYIFSAQPDVDGNPILLSHTIDINFLLERPKRAGIVSFPNEKYYLVVKLIHGTGQGSFIVRLVIEFRLSLIIAVAGINIIALVYIGRQSLIYKKLRA